MIRTSKVVSPVFYVVNYEFNKISKIPQKYWVIWFRCGTDWNHFSVNTIDATETYVAVPNGDSVAIKLLSEYEAENSKTYIFQPIE